MTDKAVSDSAWEAWKGNDEHGMGREWLEAEVAGDGLVLCTRAEWDALKQRAERAEDARDALAHEVATTRAEIKARYAVEQKDVWYWMGDGSDHPESLANGGHVVMTGAQVRALTARLAAAEVNAERYVWLRDECIPEKHPQHTWIVEAPPEDWDAAIDAAIAQETKQ